MSDDFSNDVRPRYHLSGNLGMLPPVLMLVALIAGVMVGFLIGKLGFSSSSDRVAIGIPLIFGLGIGYMCFWIGQQLHCRNALYVQAAALLGGFAAVYGLAVGYLSALTQSPAWTLAPVPAGDLFFDPGLIVSTLMSVMNAGIIYHGRFPASPGSLQLEWTLKALCLLVPGVVLARISMLRQVYCEDCQKWLDIGRKKLLFPLSSNRDDLNRLKDGDLSVLLEQALHRPIHASRPPYVRLDYVLCNKCGNTGVFRVMSVTQRKAQWLSSSWTHPFGGLAHDEKNTSETALTYLMQLTPDAAHQLGQLQERDRETKAVNPKPIPRPPRPAQSPKPTKLSKPLKPTKRPGQGPSKGAKSPPDSTAGE